MPPTPQKGDTVAISKSTYVVTALALVYFREVEARKVSGPAPDSHVAFPLRLIKQLGPGHWKANSYTAIKAKAA